MSERGGGDRIAPLAYSARVVAVGTLGVAAVLKTHQQVTSSERDLLAILVSCFEAIVMIALLLPRTANLAHILTACCFSILCGVALQSHLAGVENCGCFGYLEVRPVFTAVLDGTVAGFLWLTAPPARPITSVAWAARMMDRRISAAVLVVSGVLGFLTQGFVQSQRTFIVLGDALQVGKPFPPSELAPFLRMRTDDGVAVFYRRGCQACEEAIADYLLIRRVRDNGPARVHFIEVPENASGASAPGDQLVDRLPSDRLYVIQTPYEVVYAHGAIISASGDLPWLRKQMTSDSSLEREKVAAF